MHRWHRRLARLTGPALLLGAFVLAAAHAPADEPTTRKRDNPATRPARKNPERHEKFLEEAKKGDIEVVFFGDSITDGWRGGGGKEVWDRHFKPLKAVNFGIGGDRTQHVLWRIEHGELEGYHPRVAVLMIGTNNLHDNTAGQIADGIKAIVREIHRRQPNTKILLLGIFPRSPRATDKVRDKIKEINQMISRLGDETYVRYLDIGKKFLDKEGNLHKEIMPDYLHLSRKGYEIWARAIEPTLKKMVVEER